MAASCSSVLHGPSAEQVVLPQWVLSCDADGLRASEIEHSIEDVHGNRHLGLGVREAVLKRLEPRGQA